MCKFRSQDRLHSPTMGLPPLALWHHVGVTIGITLDKNGSFIDPSGTESPHVQIWLETMQVQVVDQTTHPPKCHSFVVSSSPPARRREKRKKGKVLHLFRCCLHTHIFPITKTVYKLLTWRNPQETKVFFSILGSWTPQTSAAARPGAAHRAGLVGCRGGSPRAPVDDRCPWPARSSNVAGIFPKIRKPFFYPEKSWLLMIHW